MQRWWLALAISVPCLVLALSGWPGFRPVMAAADTPALTVSTGRVTRGDASVFLTILSTLPSAGLGALLALYLTGYDLDIMGLIGIILLIGIVKKNAIMMIDFALQAERHEGLKPAQAIQQAALLRFRPIMMTTMAALLGGIPLALGSGAGAELRTPLGIAMVGGLLLSQAMTLFTTPVIYLALDRVHRWLNHRWIARGDELPASDDGRVRAAE